MQEEKLENQLRLALSLSEEQREETPDLNVGYEPLTDRWQLIVNYYGDIEEVARRLSAELVILLGQYAILTVEEELIGQLTDFPQVLFVEKPTLLYTSAALGRSVSCVEGVQSSRLPESRRLLGTGVLIGVPDSGIDYRHPDFRNEDGTTRILALWDQVSGNGENRYGLGQIYTESAINAALAESAAGSRRAVPAGTLLSVDSTGHGTGVAGIAAGNGRASGGANRGMAPEAQLVVVRLSAGEERGFAKTTSLMMAVDFCLRVAGTAEKPIAVNISYGNNYGSHTGSSLLEGFLDQAARSYRCSIVVGSGNEGVTGRHAFVQLGEAEQEVSFVVSPGETGISLQIWKNYYDRFGITLEAPSGERVRLIPADETVSAVLGRTQLIYYYADPKPDSTQQELLLELVPMSGEGLAGGVWTLRFAPERILAGNVDLWLPVAETTNRATEFLRPSPETTLTIPSTAERVISVSAYNAATGRFAPFSGQGLLRGGGRKPDLCAPGVDVLTASPGGGYSRRTGTSFAAPFVTGGAALLLEWGIVKGNDPFLYGEKLKAYLIQGARRLPGFAEWPNAQAGWGALCVEDSLPG